MEYVDGGDLAQWVQMHRIPDVRATRPLTLSSPVSGLQSDCSHAPHAIRLVLAKLLGQVVHGSNWCVTCILR